MKYTCLLLSFAVLAAAGDAMAEGVKKERHVYAAPDGHKLKLTLYAPAEPGDAPRPAVVLFHGGGWTWGWRGLENYFARAFARHGYVAATAAYRKSPMYHFPAPVEDGKAAVRWMRLNAEKLNIDPERIGVGGHSAGGHIAMMIAATANTDKFNGTENLGPECTVTAVYSVYGAVDLRCYDGENGGVRMRHIGKRLVRTFLGATDEDFLERLEEATPITYCHSGMPPMLFVHGVKDHIVPIQSALNARRALEACGVQTEFATVRCVGHSFDYVRPWKRDDLFGRLLQFMDKHLKDEASEDTAAAD